MKKTHLLLLIVAGLNVNSGCNNTASTKSSTKNSGANNRGEVIATVGEKSITITDIEAKLKELPPHLRASYNIPKRKKEFVDNLVRFEAMLQEARRRGLEKDPEVKTMLDRIMVQQLVKIWRKEFKNKVAVTDEDIKKYYDEHQNEFIRPERIRASHIFIASTKNDPNRRKLRANTLKMLRAIKKKEKENKKTAFAEYASSQSNDSSTKQMAGNLGFKTREELTRLWGETFATAAFNLRTIGELSNIVETDKGFHLVKLSGRQRGMEQSFDSVKSRISRRVSAEKRSRSLDEYINQLKSKANVKIDEKKLSQIQFDLPPAVSGTKAVTPPAKLPYPSQSKP